MRNVLGLLCPKDDCALCYSKLAQFVRRVNHAAVYLEPQWAVYTLKGEKSVGKRQPRRDVKRANLAFPQVDCDLANCILLGFQHWRTQIEEVVRFQRAGTVKIQVDTDPAGAGFKGASNGAITEIELSALCAS